MYKINFQYRRLSDMSPKKQTICLVLALLGGVLGLHRLYLGDWKRFLMHLFLLCLLYLSYDLPDDGLFLVFCTTIGLWYVADLIAISSGRIRDGNKRFLRK